MNNVITFSILALTTQIQESTAIKKQHCSHIYKNLFISFYVVCTILYLTITIIWHIHSVRVQT